MARLPRLTLPGYPHHIIQRGNNRQGIFASEADYQTLLNLLLENAQKFKVAIHAYALMLKQLTEVLTQFGLKNCCRRGLSSCKE